MPGQYETSSNERGSSQLGELIPWALCIALCSVSAGCKEASAAELINEKSTLPERTHDGTVHWNVKGDGDTRVVVTDSQGNVIKQGVTGQVTFKPESVKAAQNVNLDLDSKTGVLHANGPDLDHGVTEVRYALLVDGRPRTGALHLPESGTQGLRDSAEAAEKSGEAGPHGGTIQLVGEQRYEVLGDSDSGQVRVYVLDDKVRPKRIKLALDADSPSIVELQWHADGYYVAEVGTRPRKATLIIVDDDDDTHVVLVGYHPGVILMLDAHPVFWVERGWVSPGLARGHYKGTIYGPPGQYSGNEAEHDKVMIKANKGGEKIHVKMH